MQPMMATHKICDQVSDRLMMTFCISQILNDSINKRNRYRAPYSVIFDYQNVEKMHLVLCVYAPDSFAGGC